MIRRDFFKLGLAGAGVAAMSADAWALRYYPNQAPKKWAVLYGTWCGSSRDAALWISEGMAGIADVFDVREKPDLRAFDHIVIGGAIRADVTRKELQEYITANRGWLKSRVRGLFAVCGNMRRPVEAKQKVTFIDNHLVKLCGVGDVPAAVFLGRITKSLMDPETAKMMAGMEDYDNLKRPECMEFGRNVLAAAVTP